MITAHRRQAAYRNTETFVVPAELHTPYQIHRESTVVNANRFVIAAVSGAATVGCHSVPSELIARALIVPGALASVLFPRLAALLPVSVRKHVFVEVTPVSPQGPAIPPIARAGLRLF